MNERLSLIGTVRKHIGKVLVVILATVCFAVLLFPFNDLSDFFTGQVSKATQNQVFLQFNTLSLSLIPTPGVALEDVSVDTPFFQGLRVGELTLTPSLTALIKGQPYGQFQASGLFRGQLSASLSSGGKTSSGITRETLRVQADNISLSELHRVFQLPVPLRGELNLMTEGEADLSLREQPDLSLDLNVQKFEIPSSNVPTPMGSLTLPELKLSQLTVKGRLSDNKFLISEGTLGKAGDDLVGTIKGNIGLTLTGGNTVTPIPGSYSLEIQLDLKKNFHDKAAIFFTLLDQYKSPLPDGFRYSFRVAGAGFQSPPTISSLR